MLLPKQPSLQEQSPFRLNMLPPLTSSRLGVVTTINSYYFNCYEQLLSYLLWFSLPHFYRFTNSPSQIIWKAHFYVLGEKWSQETAAWNVEFAVVQSFSHVRLFAIPWTVACQASLSFIIFWSLLKLMFVHWVSDAIHPSHPLSPPFPPANFSQHQGLSQLLVGSSYQVAEVLEIQLLHQSFQ